MFKNITVFITFRPRLKEEVRAESNTQEKRHWPGKVIMQ